jgi:hypothetical protein
VQNKLLIIIHNMSNLQGKKWLNFTPHGSQNLGFDSRFLTLLPLSEYQIENNPRR